MDSDEEILPALGYLVAGVTTMLARHSKETLAPFDITPVQIAILMYCLRNRVTTTAGLVSAIRLDPASISRHLVKLVRKGLIRRIRGRNDRRVVRLELTQEGRALMPQLIETMEGLNSLVNMGVSEEEKRVFMDVMRKIHENLDSGQQALTEAAAQES